MDLKAALTIGSAIFGGVAAALWFYASIVKVDYDPNEVEADGWTSAAITKDEGKRRVDVLKTAEAQTQWNARAAAAASAAAVCQVILLRY
jgi:hypothetical protein